MTRAEEQTAAEKLVYDALGITWHETESAARRIAENGAALLLEQQAEIERMKAEMTRRGKELIRKRSTLANIVSGIEDNGDHSCFGSTNDADTLRDLSESIDQFALFKEEMDAIDWPKLARERLARASAADSRLATLQTDMARLREALANAGQFAVLTLAFIGRDRGTDRFEKTIDGLMGEAKKIDELTRAALEPTASLVHQETGQPTGETDDH